VRCSLRTLNVPIYNTIIHRVCGWFSLRWRRPTIKIILLLYLCFPFRCVQRAVIDLYRARHNNGDLPARQWQYAYLYIMGVCDVWDRLPDSHNIYHIMYYIFVYKNINIFKLNYIYYLYINILAHRKILWGGVRLKKPSNSYRCKLANYISNFFSVFINILADPDIQLCVVHWHCVFLYFDGCKLICDGLIDVWLLYTRRVLSIMQSV